MIPSSLPLGKPKKKDQKDRAISTPAAVPMEGGSKTDQATSSVAPTSSSGTASSALGNQCDGRGREFSVLMRGVKRKFPGDFDVCHCCIKEAERLTHEVYRLGSFPVIINHCFLLFSKNPPAVDDALKQL